MHVRTYAGGAGEHGQKLVLHYVAFMKTSRADAACGLCLGDPSLLNTGNSCPPMLLDPPH